MDRKLLDILVCPMTRQPLAMLENKTLDALNQAVHAGQLKRQSGQAQTQPLKAGLITRDHKTVYRIDDGIPVLLAEESISTAQISDFPAA
jgi:uncharacterized protein YbaR (Trm112 family)